MGEFNVDKTTGGLNQTAGMPSEYPATQVMMSDGVTSVEDALDELSPIGYDITLNTTNVTKQSVQIAKLGKILIISVCFTTSVSPGNNIGNIKYNGQSVTLAKGAYCVTASNDTGQVVQISTGGSIDFVTTPVANKWYSIMFIVTLA